MLIRSSLLSFVMLVVGLQNAYAIDSRDPYQFFFEPTMFDFPEELEIAKEEGKQGIFIFFEQMECPFCHFMKNTIFNQSDVQEFYRKHFKLFALDIEGDIEMVDFVGGTMKLKDFAFRKNRVRATPVLAFYDLAGKRVVRFTGKTANKKEFMLLGKYYLEGKYKTMRFSKYKRLNKKATN